ncbi:receptor-interacting serine/threonine-protein kinase 3 [Brachyistius frenatus]|uniref:receptor-interacting serine/threonine-protein kinase 3 n=1 Tax=Brachyistius frenatus TaxID=100188 RepID=UPI0037E79BF9
MALVSYSPPVLIKDSTVENWNVIGSGGFGQIYKARHRQWCCDVAIKLLHYDDGSSSSLLHEVDMMRQGSNPHVIQVLGVFKGRPPSSASSAQLGLVMEFMEKGSLASLQNTLQGPPPWPLAFRLTHQVALGVNFLHSLSPPLLHLDLKPSNVLLDSFLNAKLTDFGLAKFYQSVSRGSKKKSEECGTSSYMPPEAFDMSYTPSRASDIYSYGILLWSIVTGKPPYPNAKTTLVRLRIPEGDRPSLEKIRCQAGVAGLTTLMELMKRCWEENPNRRPSSIDCTTVTEELHKMHKHAILDAVHEVLKILDQKEEERIVEQVQRVSITQTSVGARDEAVNNCDNVLTGGPPVQEVAGGWPARDTDKARLRDSTSPRRSNRCHIDQASSSTDYKVKPSSVHPIQSSPPLTGRTCQGSSIKKQLLPQCQRQFSNPDTKPASGVNIHLSNVTGFQHGNNNVMHIYANNPLERRRHPTAPPTVNHPNAVLRLQGRDRRSWPSSHGASP